MIVGISGTKGTVRIKEVSIRRGLIDCIILNFVSSKRII